MQWLNLNYQVLAHFKVGNGRSSSLRIAVGMEINVDTSRRPLDHLPQYGSRISERRFRAFVTLILPCLLTHRKIRAQDMGGSFPVEIHIIIAKTWNSCLFHAREPQLMSMHRGLEPSNGFLLCTPPSSAFCGIAGWETHSRTYRWGNLYSYKAMHRGKGRCVSREVAEQSAVVPVDR